MLRIGAVPVELLCLVFFINQQQFTLQWSLNNCCCGPARSRLGKHFLLIKHTRAGMCGTGIAVHPASWPLSRAQELRRSLHIAPLHRYHPFLGTARYFWGGGSPTLQLGRSHPDCWNPSVFQQCLSDFSLLVQHDCWELWPGVRLSHHAPFHSCVTKVCLLNLSLFLTSTFRKQGY